MAQKVVDPRAEAMKYLNENKLLALFDILGARLAKEKPESPNDFLLDELARIQQMKQNNEPVDEFYIKDVASQKFKFILSGYAVFTGRL